MAERDYYEVLGVERDASRRDIQSAYRRLAREHHPDVNPGDDSAAERIKEINEACAVLSDDERRQRYDRFGSADGPVGTNFGESFMGVQDLFDAFFGGGVSNRRQNTAIGD
jgi:molecular chaperone DnaJ